jgi:hypothetical protein
MAEAKYPKEIAKFPLMPLTIKPQLAVTTMPASGESKRKRIKGLSRYMQEPNMCRLQLVLWQTYECIYTKPRKKVDKLQDKQLAKLKCADHVYIYTISSVP